MAEDDNGLERRIERLETVLGHVEAAIAELATLLPKATGPTAGLPGRIADALTGIDDRLAAVERMGREQFELDQRLTGIDAALAELAVLLGRIEQHLDASAGPEPGPLRSDRTLERVVDSIDRIRDIAGAKRRDRKPSPE